MAERRKIVIETGAEPLPTPHFDTEATLTARPVVPLSDQETYRTNHGDYAARPAKAFWKRPALLIPIILAAVGIGIAAGFAIGMYRNRNAAQPPVATAPAPAAENTDLSQTVEPPPSAPEEVVPEPEARASVPEEIEEPRETEEPADAPKVEERERTTARTERNERKDDDDDNEARQPAVVAKPPVVVREKKPVKVDEYEIEDGRVERRAERERRREERRERRRRQRQDDINLPRGVERSVQEADRIREIFEGRRP